MVTVAELGRGEVAARLAGAGVVLETGAIRCGIRSRLRSVAAGIEQLYRHHRVREPEQGSDVTCELRPAGGVRRLYRRQVNFYADGRRIFKPLPRRQAFPMLEWGLNWCVGMQLRHALLFHAACLERGGRALIMPAPPESGKSTLAAALACRGWRLISDEVTILDLADPEARVQGMARPVSLKNASIEVIRSFAPEAFISRPCHDTWKGAVAHMRPPRDSVLRAGEPTPPAWVVFPRDRPQGPLTWGERSVPATLKALIGHSFNYPALGRRAFHRTADVVERARGYDLGYSCLGEAVEHLEALAD